MTTLRNDELQSAIITHLKAISSITNLLMTADNPTGTSEIREDQWQGDNFDYPNIRVRMISNSPAGWNDQCCQTNFTVSIMAFSQDYSSWEADKIAGIISTSLNAKSFTQDSIFMFLRTTGLIPAVRSDTHTWRAECIFQGTACYQSVSVVPPAPVIPWYLSGGISIGQCVAAYQPHNANNYSDSKINLANPGIYNCIDTGHAPDWDAVNGWKFSGTSYLFTEIHPNGNYTMFARYTNFSAPFTVGVLFGIMEDFAPFNYIEFNPKFQTTKHLYIWGSVGGGGDIVAGVKTSGSVAMNSNASYFDGAIDAITSTAWSGGDTINQLTIGAIFSPTGGGAVTFNTISNIQYFSVYNVPLSDAQILALHNATL